MKPPRRPGGDDRRPARRDRRGVPPREDAPVDGTARRDAPAGRPARPGKPGTRPAKSGAGAARGTEAPDRPRADARPDPREKSGARLRSADRPQREAGARGRRAALHGRDPLDTRPPTEDRPRARARTSGEDRAVRENRGDRTRPAPADRAGPAPRGRPGPRAQSAGGDREAPRPAADPRPRGAAAERARGDHRAGPQGRASARVRGDGAPPRDRPAARPAPRPRQAERAPASPPPAAAAERPGNRPPQRIAKLLARAGVASRREIERMIADGRVAVDGVVLDTPATLLTALHGVTVDGQPVDAPAPTRLFLFHKPPGFLTTEHDPAGRPTIYDRLPADLPRVMPVGRLDMATEGLLLLTTDGGFKRQLELPASGVPRIYRARAYGEVSQDQLEALIEGVEIEGVRYGQIDANLERRTGRNVWIEMTLKEGKNREVRRVLEYLGLQVSRLIRVAYGPFVLADLAAGGVVEVRQHDLVAFRQTLK